MWIAIGPSTRLTLHRTTQTLRGRTPRSRSDRTAIVARSSCDRRANAVESPLRRSDSDPRTIMTTIVARSRGDRGPLVAKMRAIHPRNRSRCTWELKPRHRPKEPLPRSHESASTTASIGHDLRANFPL